jgi:hypothetical protein
MLGAVIRGASSARAIRWERDQRALWRKAPGSIIVLGPADPAPVALRGTGVVLWSALERPLSLAELTARLAAEFDVDPQVMRADIEPVITRLAKAGTLRPVR